MCEMERWSEAWSWGDLHGSGLPSPIMTKKSGYLVLIKAEAESIHGWFGAPSKHFDKVLDTDTLQQVQRLRLEERRSCRKQPRQTLCISYCVGCTGGNGFLGKERKISGMAWGWWRDEIRGLECHKELRKQFLSLINQAWTGQLVLVSSYQHVGHNTRTFSSQKNSSLCSEAPKGGSNHRRGKVHLVVKMR